MTETDFEQPLAEDAADSPADETIVPAFEPPPQPVSSPPRRSGLLLAAIASVTLHGALVTVAAWAIGGGLVSLKLPTLGSRGEMAEGGLTDDPGISTMSEIRLEAEQTVVPAIAFASPTTSEENDDASTNLTEAFAAPAETPHAEPIPLIGLSDASLPDTLPSKHSFRTTVQPENQSTGRPEASRSSDGASTAISDTASIAAPTTEPGAGTAPFTPPHPTGRGAGLSGRRGGRGLDSRGLPIPDYPRVSRRRGEQGTVVLDVEVSADGHVESVAIVSSSGFPRLDEAAALAIREAEFTPTLMGGRAVGGTVRVPYRFRLD